MSFYGDIKRINSSPYVFDRIFPNRTAMEATMTSDDVYIGRYVLVKYTCKYKSDTDNTLEYFNKYAADNSTTNGKSVTAEYQANVNADIDKYHDTFDGTVWQKIYVQEKEKYILVAELNAAVPRIKLQLTNPKTFVNGAEKWNEPKIIETASSEDSYTFQLPNTLKLSVGTLSDDFYGKSLIADPSQRKVFKNLANNKTAFDPAYNQITWKNYLNGVEKTTTTGDIDEKRLDIKFYAFGQMLSDLYDVMYGRPSTEEGPRPFYTKDLSNVFQHYDKGLVGILSSIATDAKGDGSKDMYGRTLQPGMYYYFTSKWGDASEDPDCFIENIPKVVGSANEHTNGKSHYKINFTTWKLAST